MNSMERVVKALNHQEADRIPVYPIISGASRRLINASYKDWSNDADLCARGLLKAREEFDLDCIVTLIDLSVEYDAWGQELIFPENEAAHPDYSKCVVQDIEDYVKINKVDYRTSKRMMMHIETCKKVVEEAKGEFPVIAFVFGPLGTLSMLRNQQEMYMDFHNCGERIYFDAQIKRMQPEAISFLYPPDDCKDFKECKEKYGDVTTLIGCVTPASAVIGTDEEWDQECRDSIDAMAKGGGFVLAAGCEYPANASFDRAQRMVEIAKTYGKYE